MDGTQQGDQVEESEEEKASKLRQKNGGDTRRKDQKCQGEEGE